MKLKLCLENGSEDEKEIYSSWFRDMGWSLNDLFVFVDPSDDPRGLMFIRREIDQPAEVRLVHKHMFKPLSISTDLGDWL